MVKVEKTTNNLSSRNHHIIEKIYKYLYIYIFMYWENWSYGKDRMSSNLERLLYPSKKKPSSFQRYCSCFSSKKETKVVFKEENENQIHVYDQ